MGNSCCCKKNNTSRWFKGTLWRAGVQPFTAIRRDDSRMEARVARIANKRIFNAIRAVWEKHEALFPRQLYDTWEHSDGSVIVVFSTEQSNYLTSLNYLAEVARAMYDMLSHGITFERSAVIDFSNFDTICEFIASSPQEQNSRQRLAESLFAYASECLCAHQVLISTNDIPVPLRALRVATMTTPLDWQAVVSAATELSGWRCSTFQDVLDFADVTMRKIHLLDRCTFNGTLPPCLYSIRSVDQQHPLDWRHDMEYDFIALANKALTFHEDYATIQSQLTTTMYRYFDWHLLNSGSIEKQFETFMSALRNVYNMVNIECRWLVSSILNMDSTDVIQHATHLHTGAVAIVTSKDVIPITAVIKILSAEEWHVTDAFINRNGAFPRILASCHAEHWHAIIMEKCVTINDINSDVVMSLKMLHEAGFVHCDVCEDNILLDGNSRPVLIDFGLAKPIGAKSRGLFGHVDVAAPTESIEARPLRPNFDMIALFFVVWKLLCGGSLPWTECINAKLINATDVNTMWRAKRECLEIFSEITIAKKDSSLVPSKLRPLRDACFCEQTDYDRIAFLISNLANDKLEL